MPSRFVRFLLILTAVLSLVVITIPELGIIPLITVIGIPLAYLYWAMPGIFLCLLIFTVFHGLLPVRGFPSLFMSSLLTFAVLQFGASLINNRILADVNALQTGDVNRISLPLSTRVIAYRSVEKGCDAFCVNALLSGAAEKFLILPWNESEPKIVPDTIVRSYQFKGQAECRPLNTNGAPEHRNLDLFPDIASGSGAVTVAQLLSLAHAQGHCLTLGTARLGEADIVISRGRIQSGRSIRELGFHFGGDTISAFRTRVYQRNIETSRYTEIYRRTTGEYALVYSPLFSGPNFGYGLDAGVGWNWKEQFFNRMKHPKRGSWPGFLTRTLGMDFSISPSDQSAAVSTSVEKYREDVQDMIAPVIHSGKLPSRVQWSALTTYWDKLRLTHLKSEFGLPPDETDIEIGLALLADPSLPAPPRLGSFINYLRHNSLVTDKALAKMFLDRLGQTDPWQENEDQHVRKWRRLSYRYVLRELSELPPQVLLGYYQEMLRAAENPGSYDKDTPVLMFFSLFGNDGVPPLLKMVETGLSTGHHARYGTGALGLCRLPPLVGEDKYQLVNAINLSTVGWSNTFQPRMISLLVKAGYTAETLWPLLEKKPFPTLEEEKLVQTFEKYSKSQKYACE